MSSNKFLSIFIHLLAGIIFGIGLAISGMMDPAVVKGFLDLTGNWNYSLVFVMLGAIATTTTGYYFIFKKNKPVLSEEFKLASKNNLDSQLVIGAGLFGLGWGLYGYCPGPALSALGGLNTYTIIFVLSMVAGMLAANRVKPIIFKN